MVRREHELCFYITFLLAMQRCILKLLLLLLLTVIMASKRRRILHYVYVVLM